MLHGKITINYPKDEVERLIDFATEGIETHDVYFAVKNTKRTYRGRAYAFVPSISPASKIDGVRYLITLALGKESNFPCSSEHYTWKWDSEKREYFKVMKGHGYGGKKSPIIVTNDWKETLVALAAHEARHIYQYRHRAPRCEVDCENWALSVLENYRRSIA